MNASHPITNTEDVAACQWTCRCFCWRDVAFTSVEAKNQNLYMSMKWRRFFGIKEPNWPGTSQRVPKGLASQTNKTHQILFRWPDWGAITISTTWKQEMILITLANSLWQHWYSIVYTKGTWFTGFPTYLSNFMSLTSLIIIPCRFLFDNSHHHQIS